MKRHVCRAYIVTNILLFCVIEREDQFRCCFVSANCAVVDNKRVYCSSPDPEVSFQNVVKKAGKQGPYQTGKCNYSPIFSTQTMYALQMCFCIFPFYKALFPFFLHHYCLLTLYTTNFLIWNAFHCFYYVTLNGPPCRSDVIHP